MVKIICVDGCNIENKERIAAFCSEELKAAGIYEISSIGEEDQLTFCVDETNIIKFTSERSFGILAPKKF